MCSGCSGEYDGGFDFDDQEEEPTDSSEVNLERSARHGAASRPRLAGADRGDRVAEDYEILVTATQIIEIRTICSDSASAGSLHAKALAFPAADRECRQTPARAAKYYPTFLGCAESAGGDAALSTSARGSSVVASTQPGKSRSWLARACQVIFRLRSAN